MSKYFDIYDKNYYERYVKQALSDLGQQIYQARWQLIQRYLKGGTILDYGCGPNICNASAPKTFDTYGYDINPECGQMIIPDKKWDAVLFWDSIEHIPDFYNLIKDLNPNYLFITTPNLENASIPITQWKHYRPGEHIFYFDRYSLEVILDHIGYTILKIDWNEGQLRNPKRPKDIISIIAKKKVDNGAFSS